MTKETAGRVALVTGGSRGIGLGIAKALAREGWNLAINGVRDAALVAEALASLREVGAEVVYCRGDVGQAADRQALVEQAYGHFGQIHLLVNNAGITSPGRRDLLDATEDAFDRVMAVNLKGPYFLTQLVARRMIDQRQESDQFSATIVNLSSISAEYASVNRGDYCISRAGVGMVTRLWATRLAEFGIGVYEVRPGVIRTDMTAGVTEKYDKLIAEGLTLEPRWGEPEDVGRTVAMLARGDMPYATGNVIMIDGGMSIPRL
jgi:3-oxoacyl-[acyl-carrier protein] reductase